MEFLSSFGYSLLFLCIYMRCKSSTFKMTGATQMMKAMHKIRLSFTSSSQRIAVMERKGKEKKTRFLLSYSIHKEIERQDCIHWSHLEYSFQIRFRSLQGQHTSVHQKFLERKGGRSQLAHLWQLHQVSTALMKPELCHRVWQCTGIHRHPSTPCSPYKFSPELVEVWAS